MWDERSGIADVARTAGRDAVKAVTGAGSKPAANRKELLRQTVLDAAAELFAERGLAGTSFQDIADALGVGRTAIYYYFKSKEEVLASLVEEITVFSDQQSTALAARTDQDAAQLLRGMVGNHVTLLLTHATQFRVIDRTENELPSDVRTVHDRSKRALLDNFTNLIVKGIEQGVFRPVEPRIAAFSLIGMCNWTTWWFKPDGRKSVHEVADILADLAVNGLLRPDARRTKAEEAADLFRLLREDLDYLEILYNRSRS